MDREHRPAAGRQTGETMEEAESLVDQAVREAVAEDVQTDYIAISRHLFSLYEPGRLHRVAGMRAGVMLPLYEKQGVQHVVLTKRSDLVEHHKGQISFPGGMVEPGDRDIVATALREAHEEIGVEPADVEILGALDDIVTTSNFHVSPVVGVIGSSPYPFTMHPQEVAEVIEIPIAFLVDDLNLVEEPRESDGRRFINYIYSYEGHGVWGATGQILHQYVELLKAGLALRTGASV
ncbi:MAG: NUDIX domain-containing protein [Dehalococcoidia bacterium]|nr:NUDIX domain-containing protein [Dehalococcoidia bacterium]